MTLADIDTYSKVVDVSVIIEVGVEERCRVSSWIAGTLTTACQQYFLLFKSLLLLFKYLLLQKRSTLGSDVPLAMFHL